MKPISQLPPPPVTYRVTHAAVGPFLQILGLSCRKTFELCSDRMDRKLTTGESCRLWFHLLTCGICRHLPTQFRGLRALVRACESARVPDELTDDQLSPQVIERIVERLKNDPK